MKPIEIKQPIISSNTLEEMKKFFAEHSLQKVLEARKAEKEAK